MSDLLGAGKAIEKLLDPVNDLIKRVAGPAADEIGLTIQDSVKVYRAKRQYALLEKMSRFAEQAKFTPQRISLKLLLPAMDYASVEDNEQVHTMWAALLANASRSGTDEIPPAFAEILRQLSPRHAAYLVSIYQTTWTRAHPQHRDRYTPLQVVRDRKYSDEQLFAFWVDLGYAKTGHAARSSPMGTPEEEKQKQEDSRAYQVTFENLLRLGLLERHQELTIRVPVSGPHGRGQFAGTKLPYDAEDRYSLSVIACHLVETCTPPEPELAPITYHEL